MGDFVYNGEHSITIDPEGINVNTWGTWHMAPKSRPFVVAPSVKEEYIDIPGADGSLDYTEVLSGKPRYANRTGTWEFLIDNGYRDWHELYSEIMMKLHGKKFDKIVLDDDPTYYWKGRLSISGQFGNKDFNTVTISYNLDPYKYPSDYTSNTIWYWNDLFSNTIIYGPFNVYSYKARNIINDQDEDIVAVFTSTSRMKIFPYTGNGDLYNLIAREWDEETREYYEIYAGDNEYVLHPGNNFLFFLGDGQVTVSYERGKTL